jgi:hypothetical protein
MPECNHPKPPYYDAPNGVTIEAIIRGYELTPYEAWAVKYIIRKKSNKLRDLRKSSECLDREITYLESARVATILECRCHVAAGSAAPSASQGSDLAERILRVVGDGEMGITQLCAEMGAVGQAQADIKVEVWSLVNERQLELTTMRTLRRPAAVSQADGAA